MTDLRRQCAVVATPSEIDVSNADDVAAILRAACHPGHAVIVDMAATTFCDSRGTQEILRAHYMAQKLDCAFRVASPTHIVLRAWHLLGADQVLAIYPTLRDAQAMRGLAPRLAVVASRRQLRVR